MGGRLSMATRAELLEVVRERYGSASATGYGAGATNNKTQSSAQISAQRLEFILNRRRSNGTVARRGCFCLQA